MNNAELCILSGEGRGLVFDSQKKEQTVIKSLRRMHGPQIVFHRFFIVPGKMDVFYPDGFETIEEANQAAPEIIKKYHLPEDTKLKISNEIGEDSEYSVLVGTVVKPRVHGKNNRYKIRGAAIDGHKHR